MQDKQSTYTTGGKRMLTLYLTSRKVLVLKEKEAFSFTSLVADIGGVLGLFIGFNFLMIWDGFVLTMRKCLSQRNFMLCSFFNKSK